MRIEGATQSTYTIRPQDTGKKLTVTVSFTDSAKQSETATSVPTLPIDSIHTNTAPIDILYPTDRSIKSEVMGAVIGRLTPKDLDREDDYLFRVDDDRFEVDVYGLLKLKSNQAIDNQQDKNVTLNITLLDRAGASFAKAITIPVRHKL